MQSGCGTGWHLLCAEMIFGCGLCDAVMTGAVARLGYANCHICVVGET